MGKLLQALDQFDEEKREECKVKLHAAFFRRYRRRGEARRRARRDRDVGSSSPPRSSEHADPVPGFLTSPLINLSHHWTSSRDLQTGGWTSLLMDRPDSCSPTCQARCPGQLASWPAADQQQQQHHHPDQQQQLSTWLARCSTRSLAGRERLQRMLVLGASAVCETKRYSCKHEHDKQQTLACASAGLRPESDVAEQSEQTRRARVRALFGPVLSKRLFWQARLASWVHHEGRQQPTTWASQAAA